MRRCVQGDLIISYLFPFVCRFGDEYATLKARVLKTLCDAAGLDKALATQYGGIVAISLFGPKAIDAFLLPLAVDYWKRWEAELDQSSDLEYRLELQMCKQAVLVRFLTYKIVVQSCPIACSPIRRFALLQNSVRVFLSQESRASQALRLGWEELEDTFGDRLVMFSHEETDYALCAI
jgi:hypothetical protein